MQPTKGRVDRHTMLWQDGYSSKKGMGPVYSQKITTNSTDDSEYYILDLSKFWHDKRLHSSPTTAWLTLKNFAFVRDSFLQCPLLILAWDSLCWREPESFEDAPTSGSALSQCNISDFINTMSQCEIFSGIYFPQWALQNECSSDSILAVERLLWLDVQ